MIAKLEKISDRTYRLVAGISYAVLAVFIVLWLIKGSWFSILFRNLRNDTTLLPLLISSILLAIGILFSMSELVLGGIIANIAAWAFVFITGIPFYMTIIESIDLINLKYCVFEFIDLINLIYCVLVIGLFIFALMTLAGKNTKSFQNAVIYTKFAFSVIYTAVFVIVLSFLPFLPIIYLLLNIFYLFIETIAFISLLMLIYRGSICMPKKTAISQHTKSNSVSNKIETLSNLKDLLDTGTITQEEFDTKKQQLLE